MKTNIRTLLTIICISCFCSAAKAQLFYAVESNTLKVFNPDTFTEISSIAAISGDSTQARAMAWDPISSTMYISSPDELMTINLSTAVTSLIDSFTSTSIRSMVFDDTGTLWATGQDEILYTINTSNAAMTEENTSLGMSRPGIFFNPNDDLLYLIGRSSGNLSMATIDPNSPGTLTPVTITPTVSSGNIVAGGVHDPINNRFLVQDGMSMNIYGIDPDGSSTLIANKSNNIFGMAFDSITPSKVIDWQVYY